MDLRQFYLQNVSKKEYYFKFYNLISNTDQEIEGDASKFFVYDIDEAIEKLKYLCLPENEHHNKEEECWFYLILFYLNKSGFVIDEFPRIIEHPPANSFDFVNKEIRTRLIAEGKMVNGKIQWDTRRQFIASLTFVQRKSFVELDDAIEKKFKEISNRQASFQSMSTDEKLAEISNLIEHMLKKEKEYISLDYSQICFNYINEETIKLFRKKLHCFRHSSTEAITERNSITNEQKNFLIDFGLTVVKVIHELLQKNK